MSVIVKSTPASLAIANRWSTVLVEPPIAISRVMALSKAALLAMLRGRTESSPRAYQVSHMVTICRAACSKSCSRLEWVATTVPLPGKANPRASLRQFMELAVNMPEQEPQVGHAERSTSAISSSETDESPAITMASTKS